MTMQFYRRDNARSTAVEPRAVGGPTLIVASADASKFGTPSASSYMRVSVFASDGTPKGVLLCDGRDGTALSVVGPDADAGYSDFEVVAGDVVACVPTAADFAPDEFRWAATGGLLGYGDGTTESPFTFTTNPEVICMVERLNDGLATKQDILPTDGTEGQFLASDGTWKTPPAPDLSDYVQVDTTDALDTRVTTLEAAPNPLILLASWSLPLPASGIACPERPGVPVDFEAAFVTCNAAVNPVGGGLSFNIACGGVDLWASPNTYAEDKTDMLSISMFDAGDLGAGGLFSLTISSLGTGVESVVIQLWGTQS